MKNVGYFMIIGMILFLVSCMPEAEVAVPVAVEVEAEGAAETGNRPLDITLAPGILMPQLKERSTDFMEALLVGDLVLQDDCLHITSEGESYLVVWQAGYFLNDRDGTIEVVDERGEVVAQVGEKIYMGGGAVPFTAELESQLSEPLPEACGKPQGVWLMGEFLPEEYRENVDG